MAATDSYLLLRAFCDELARCGVRNACTSPGSRSTPIVLSLARAERIRCWSHIDERCAAFFALGAAKASGRPVALTCTSGTAASNFAPAVTEAFHARVPLIVLTADRPPELRDIGAGQTIDQLKLYGDTVKLFVEVGVQPGDAATMRWIRTLACRVYAAAVTGRPGPVHVNFPLQEPLVLEAPLGEEPGGGGRADGRPWVEIVDAPRAVLDTLAPSSFDRAIIVAGAGSDRSAGVAAPGRALAALAERARVPLLADPLSGARRGPAAIAHYDLLLRPGGIGEALAPRSVLRFGELPTSKPLRTWLASLEVDQVQIGDDASWHDPASRIAAQVIGGISSAALALAGPALVPDTGDWLERWRAADALAATAIAETIDPSVLSEPRVASLLGELLPADATLFVASSMPIRDVEEFVAVRDDGPRFLSNRGANGIDGTVSSAFGAAAVSDGPVVLLIGDVALAHDLGGLLAVRRLELALTIVLINNDGGGIFHFLPVAGETDAFEEHVATPHGLDFAHAAAAYGCSHSRVESKNALAEAVTTSLSSPRATNIIEVRTDRAANRQLHRDVETRALAALSGAPVRVA